VPPFPLALPHVDLFRTGVLSFVVGVVIASAFPAIMSCFVAVIYDLRDSEVIILD
jgi:hypothetical protein